ncbi:unnamed protein product [Ascophyllum nodosum]
MTSTVCRDHCTHKNTMYYATQYGNECWCGTSGLFADYEKHGKGTCNNALHGRQIGCVRRRNAFSLYRFIDEDPELPAPDPELTSPNLSSFLPRNLFPSLAEINSVNYGSSYPYDGSTFSGDGTYYGTTSNGNCAIRSPIPSMYDDMIPVALNSAQYGDSEMCGACIEGEDRVMAQAAILSPDHLRPM